MQTQAIQQNPTNSKKYFLSALLNVTSQSRTWPLYLSDYLRWVTFHAHQHSAHSGHARLTSYGWHQFQVQKCSAAAHMPAFQLEKTVQARWRLKTLQCSVHSTIQSYCTLATLSRLKSSSHA